MYIDVLFTGSVEVAPFAEPFSMLAWYIADSSRVMGMLAFPVHPSFGQIKHDLPGLHFILRSPPQKSKSMQILRKYPLHF
jgi:hypothetical protein